MVRNDIYASGRIVNEHKINEKDTVITLLVKGQRDAYPHFLCANDKIPPHNERAHMTVKAYMDGGSKKANNGSEKFEQIMRVDEINTAEPMLNSVFGVQGKFFYSSKFEYYVTGTLVSVTEDNEWLRYIVSTFTHKGKPTEVKMHWKKTDRHPELSEGDSICAICKISTPEKMVGTKKRHFQDIIVLDMAKLNE